MVNIQDLIENNEYEKAEQVLESMMHDDPGGDALIKLVLLLISDYYYDPEKAIELCKRCKGDNNKREEMLLLWAYIEIFAFGQLSSECITEITANDWIKYRNIGFFLLAKNYYNSQQDRLGESINMLRAISESEPDFVKSHYLLFRYYKSLANSNACKHYSKKIIHGVRKVFGRGDSVDILDWDNLINELIKGSHLSLPNFESMFLDIFDFPEP